MVASFKSLRDCSTLLPKQNNQKQRQEEGELTMQREEKQLEAALDTIIQRVNDLKGSLSSLIVRLEHEHEVIQWPSMLDSFALISGQMNTLLKALKHERTPLLRNLVLLPLLLSPDPDENLSRMTDSRVPAFTHDLVPDLLRTKPDPEVELRQGQLEQRAAQTPPDTAQKQVNALNKIVNNVVELISQAREEWESEATARANAATTWNTSDSQALVAAVGFGRNLKPNVPMPGPPSGPPNAGPGGIRPNAPGAGGKAPSTVKTNIKAAGQVHPYR